MQSGGGTSQRNYGALLAAIVALGLALRIAGAQGGLWLDEAWSAKLAHDAGTPLGVFLNINHDNNHHLNSLWLQFVGIDAAPLLARALSILTGTVAIPIAAAIGRRRSPLIALVTAALFAVSPMLVTLGSEARGYAPMALALLVAILLTDRWLGGDMERRPSTALALAFFLGAFAQLIMLFGFCAVAGWAALALWRRRGLRAAAIEMLRLFGPAVLALVAVVAIVFGAAEASPTGFQFGRYEAFALLPFLQALADMPGYCFGLPFSSFLWLAVPPLLLLLASRQGVARLELHWLAIIAFPLALALLQAGNVGHPRYYLVANLALLLLAGEMIGLALAAGGWRRWLGAILLMAMFAGSLSQDVDLAINRRGDPSGAIRAMETRSPAGARVLLDGDTGRALIEVAAAQSRYPLTIVRACSAERFLFLHRFRDETFPDRPVRCGVVYTPIAAGRARGLSGTHWTLYERTR